MDMGTGKTSTTINAMREKFVEHKRILRTLILCPVAVCSGWLREFKSHAAPSVNERVFVLSGSAKDRIKRFKEATAKYGGCIFVMNYEGLSMKALYNLIEGWRPEIMVSDECQRIKNPHAKRSEACWRLADGALIKYILTGTPILNSPLDIFSQYRFLDNGETFGRNFYSFRATYFHDKNAGMPSHKHFPNWQPLDGIDEVFNQKIYKKAVRVMKDACLDLPPFIRETVEAELGPEQGKAYREMHDYFLSYINNDDAVTAELAITKSLRLQQILSGHAVLDESGEVHKFKSVPRLDTLGDIASGIPLTSKFVVWACFRENYKDIKEVVEKLGIGCVQLVGGMSKEARETALERFKNDSTVRCLIGNPASAGVGVDGLQVANYAIYYSRNFNLEHDLQSNDRIYRGGSEVHRKVTRIDIVTPGTIDELILESLKNKHTSAEAILHWRKKL